MSQQRLSFLMGMMPGNAGQLGSFQGGAVFSAGRMYGVAPSNTMALYRPHYYGGTDNPYYRI